MKTCTKCGVEQPKENFHKHSRAKDGLQSWCKSCKAKIAEEYNDRPDIQLRLKTSRWEKEGAPKPKRIGWVEDGVGYIPLTKGQVSKVDPEDVTELSKKQWYAFWNKSTQSYYAFNDHRFSDGSRVTCGIHRYLLGITDPSLDGEHKNHDTLDNRRGNLRPATRTENNENSRLRSDSQTGFKGVGIDKRRKKKFVARIKIEGKTKHIGYYYTAEEAFEARRLAAEETYGEFASHDSREEDVCSIKAVPAEK